MLHLDQHPSTTGFLEAITSSALYRSRAKSPTAIAITQVWADLSTKKARPQICNLTLFVELS